MTEPSEALKKADELAAAVRGYRMATGPDYRAAFASFIQQVSDAAKAARMAIAASERDVAVELLALFILPEPVDPLADIFEEMGWRAAPNMAEELREALAKRGLKIVEASHDG